MELTNTERRVLEAVQSLEAEEKPGFGFSLMRKTRMLGSTLYPILYRLVGLGLLERIPGDPAVEELNERRTRYVLTDIGRHVLTS